LILPTYRAFSEFLKRGWAALGTILQNTLFKTLLDFFCPAHIDSDRISMGRHAGRAARVWDVTGQSACAFASGHDQAS
jgi:hypothetical protein